MKKIIILLAAAMIAGCSLYKFGNNPSDKKITSFSFNYNKEKVTGSIFSILETNGYIIKSVNDDSSEIITDYKRIKGTDDAKTLLRSISDLPDSPVSEYIEAAYYLSISIEPDRIKTNVYIKNNIEAMERGRYNRTISINSNGGKEKELLAKLLKALK